jgi:hypothetical protein
MTDHAASAFAEPLQAFVREARVRMALLLETSGRVLAQHGFTRSLDVMSACSLVSAIHASASELGRQLHGEPFGPLHHAGTERQVFLAPLPSGGRTVLLLAVFDGSSSLGIVRLFWSEFARSVADAPRAPSSVHAPDFERELQHNLAVLFGRA